MAEDGLTYAPWPRVLNHCADCLRGTRFTVCGSMEAERLSSDPYGVEVVVVSDADRLLRSAGHPVKCPPSQAPRALTLARAIMPGNLTLYLPKSGLPLCLARSGGPASAYSCFTMRNDTSALRNTLVLMRTSTRGR
jgi:hypothetical protein